MVTKPQTTRVPVALPDDYVCPDPERREMIQAPTIDKAGYFATRHFKDRANTYVRSAGVVNYDPYDMNRRFEPDLCVAFDVDMPPILRRHGYIIWEVGKPPDFVMEVASESTHDRDTGFKRDLYASLGIAEYWRVDPTGGDLYGYPIAGGRLVDGAYQEIALEREADGMVWGYSPTLDLCLCWHPTWDWDVDDESHLRIYDRKTGRYLCDMTLVEERLAAQQAALAAEQAAREAERNSRLDAEARIRELEARLRGQSDNA
jgi:hypothetical protein